MKAGFLFGAGAEVGYGLPTGGKFALEIFRQDSSKSKLKFKENRDLIDSSTAYAANWLPDDYLSKSVGSYGKTVFESIIRDTIEHNRERIIKKLNDFDEIAKFEEEKLNKRYAKTITAIIEEKLGKKLNNCNLKQQISFINYFEEGNKIFSSNYLSALLMIYKDKTLIPDNIRIELRKIILSIFQLQIGALGERLSKKINDGIFSKKDDEIDLFDDIGEILQLNYQSSGLSGLEYVMEARPIETIEDDDNAILQFARNIIENIYSSVLDYKTLIDSNWHYLYCPKEEWAKFCKINIFLHTVRTYIKDQFKSVGGYSNEGYYHDLKSKIESGEIEPTTIATTNYNTFIKEILDTEICYLNGSTELWYDPYINRIGTKEELNAHEIHFLVPLLFTQSGTKPMTCIEMSKKYVKMYDDFKSSDLLCIIGFGFNTDDEHINGIIRTLIDIDDKHIVVIDINPDTNSEKIAEKLKTNKLDNIHVVNIDKNRQSNDANWIECIAL